ncbi:MAG: glycoside hydrolase family 92 protein [Bacteroidetes bacterium]|nr:glycoside hydrolase family 92 protein [Bacteroidota bacterium]
MRNHLFNDGLLSVCPTKAEYVLSSPSFDEIRIQPSRNSQPFVIKTVANTPQSPYVSSVQLNHTPFLGYTLKHDQIVKGGKER